MTKKLVFLLEEPSMEEFLNGFLPRVLTDDWLWECVPHQGKSDLEKSIPRKLRAWREPGARFVVIRDQDSGDCAKIKDRLQLLCDDSGGNRDVLIRIACRELESWFLGNLQAVDDAFGLNKLGRLQVNEKYRKPDKLLKPSDELKRLVPSYQKLSGARVMGRCLDIGENRSRSFRAFVTGIQNYIGG